MPDTPDREKQNFRKEGLTFPPPQSTGRAGPRTPAQPQSAGGTEPRTSIQPKTPGRTSPNVSAQPKAPEVAQKPERRAVPPKGYTPAPKPGEGPASRSAGRMVPVPKPEPRSGGQERPKTAPRDTVPGSPSKPAAKPASKLEQRAERHGIKLRRRPRAFTGFLAGMLYVLIVLGISFWLGTTAWSWAMDVLALQKQAVEASIVYTEDMSVSDLAKMLKEKGLIEYEWLFRLYCDISDAEEKMSPGEYETNLEDNPSAKDYRALVYMLSPESKERAQVTITFREGLSEKQIFQMLEEKKIAGVKELEEAAATMNWSYTYLKNLPAVPNRLEGYLFPETYTFYVNESPTSAIQKFVREFNRRLTREMLDKAEASDYTLHEIITIASMIEAESGPEMEERKNIASVIYNRLENWETPMLNIDATLIYFMEGRREITQADLDTDNPYNTYIYPGLPPGPICSPSIESIQAALSPNKTQYYYYLLDDEGVTQFCKTQDEFNQKKNSYQRYNS